MKIESISGPNTLSPPNSTPSAASTSARDRAIAMVSGQSSPVANPSKVSPEEFTALRTSASQESRQTSSNETPAEGVSEEATKAKEDPISTQYAILARKEKALRAKVQEIKAKEDAIKASEAAREAAAARESRSREEVSFKDRLAKDPMSVLNELGITYDQLTSSAVNQPSAEEQRIAALEAKYEAKFKALEDAQEGTKKNFEEQQKSQYTQAVTQIRNEAKSLVASNPEFEMIKDSNSVNDVVDLIEQTFKTDGVLLTVEEAAREVENYLIEEAMKIVKFKKIQQRLQPKETPEAEKSPNQALKSPTMKTLTNAVGTNRALTSKERAILAFKGELK